MDRHKLFAAIGTVLVVALPVVAHSAFGANPNVRLVLDIVSASLAALGFTVTKPLVRGNDGTGLIGTVDDIEERQVINRAKGITRAEALGLIASCALILISIWFGGCALPLQHVQRCDAMHARAIGWKATAAVTGALSGAGVATALGLDGTTGQRVAGAAALVLGGVSSLAIFETGQAEHDYALECEAPLYQPQPSPAPVAVTP